MIKLKELLFEEVEYYFDKTKDNLEKYVAFDGTDYYTGKHDFKGEKSFLKFVRTHPKFRAIYSIRLEKNKLKKVSSKDIEKDVGEFITDVEFNRLYKR